MFNLTTVRRPSFQSTRRRLSSIPPAPVQAQLTQEQRKERARAILARYL